MKTKQSEPIDAAKNSTSHNVSPPPSCPHCRSHKTVLIDRGKKAGAVIGTLAGAASGVSGALSAGVAGAKAGSIAGAAALRFNPPLGAIAGAVIGGLSGGIAGCAIGTALGESIDQAVLGNRRCLACGLSFTALEP
jgi:hypothetical protein